MLWLIPWMFALATPVTFFIFDVRLGRDESTMHSVELAIVAVVLFFSGFAAWNIERDRNDDKYRGLNERQRIAIVKRIGSISPSPTIMVHVTDTQDCVEFGRDLVDTLERAFIGAMTMTPPVPIDRASNPLPTGITIVARADDARAAAIRKALRKVAKLPATLKTNDHEMFLEINIGTRLS
jgi:hypothetical protein